MKKYCLYALALLLLLTAATLHAKGRNEAACTADMAKLEIELAKWCLSKKMFTEAAQWNNAAAAHNPASKDTATLAQVLAKAGPGKEPGDTLKEEYQKKTAKLREKLCALALEIAQTSSQGKQHDKAAQWVVQALEWQPDSKEAAALLGPLWQKAMEDKRWSDAYKLTELHVKYEPGAAGLKEAQEFLRIQSATTSIVKLQCKTHAMIYRVALPEDWDPQRKWPVILAVEGAGCDWEAYMNGFLNAGSRKKGFVLLTLETTSNTNGLEGVKGKYSYPEEVFAEMMKPGFQRMKHDVEGLHAVLDEAESLFKIDRAKLFVTGFSGGGILTYYMIFQEWDALVAAAPSSPNFVGTYGEPKDGEAEKTLPILVSVGDKDQYLENIIGPSVKAAMQTLEKYKYVNAREVHDPEAGHVSFANTVVEFFEKALAEAK